MTNKVVNSALGRRLPRLLPMEDDELPISYVARLAWLNGFRTLHEFCRFSSTRWTDLSAMKDEIRYKLSWMSGIDASLFGDHMLSDRVSNSSHKHSPGRNVVRYCASCLKSDEIPFIRSAWQWTYIPVCAHHGTTFEYTTNLEKLGSFIELPATIGKVEHEAVRRMSEYLTSSTLGATTPSDILDGMPGVMKVTFCAALGFLDAQLKRDSRRVYDLSDVSIAALGFPVAIGGRACVWKYCTAQFAAWRRQSSDQWNFYRPLFQWTEAHRGEVEAEPVLKLISEHTSKFITRETGSARRLPLLTRDRTYLTPPRAAQRLGCSPSNIRELMRTGLLTKYTENLMMRVSDAEIDLGELTRLWTKVTKNRHPNLPLTSCISLKTYLILYEMSFAEIISLMAEGRLRRYRFLNDAYSADNLLLDPFEFAIDVS